MQGNALAALWHPGFAWWIFVIRGTVVYLSVLLLLRIGGKREIAQMGPAEFVAILLISNAVQNSMNGGDNSVVGGLILAAVIVGLSALVAYLTFKYRFWASLFIGRPTLLIHEGKLLHRHLQSELMTVHDLLIKLRQLGIVNLDEVAEATLESDGHITAIKKSDKPAAVRSSGA